MKSTTIMQEYIAHSANADGLEQPLREHNRAVGEFMRDTALDARSAGLFEFTGSTHDMGKYQTAFQEYIRSGGRRGSVPHSIWGALHANDSKLLAAAFAIAGHHAGLPNLSDLKQAIRKDKDEPAYHEAVDNWLKETAGTVPQPDNSFFNGLDDIFLKELFTRYLFSALVDADWLDTERHFDSGRCELRIPPPLDTDLMRSKLEERFSKFGDSPLNRLRTAVREYATGKSGLPRGFYSLTLPTGMGKTLCSIDWALRHAEAHGMRRIIIVLPFISIIDQTAETLKSIFGPEYILEHHSDMEVPEKKDETYDRKQLATENWDYPIVVTTSVQFFGSLFGNKPSKCRKVHNIKDSVIIFDEVQTLPKELIAPTLTMLDNVQRLMKCSMLFCTATQPAFESREGFRGIDRMESLVENPAEIFSLTRRVRYVPVDGYDPIDIDTLAEKVMACGTSALIVTNTKSKAARLFEALRRTDGYTCLHLSTSMCPAHRKDTIKKIKGALARGEKVLVSSTQLIEAGVDMDFPTVFRERAPLESIIQSGGRCNREGTQKEGGTVHIFVLSDSGCPDRTYDGLGRFALGLYEGREEKLLTYDFFTDYYRAAIREFYEPDKHRINDYRKKFEFETVAATYRLIDSNTVPLFVYEYDTDSRALYFKLKDKEYLTREERRRMSQYCVQVYDNMLKKGLPVTMEKAGFYSWLGKYDERIGLQPPKEMDNLLL